MDASEYEDVAGFCKDASLDEIRGHGHVLTPGRYVGLALATDDGEPTEEKMARLVSLLFEEQEKGASLDAAILRNLKRLGHGR